MVQKELSDARRRALRAEYTSRINRVLDHIEAHLAEELTLDELARVACFSSFHFHRVFRAMTGEPLGRFIQRLRLERAASQLLATPDKPITEVALDSGFSGSDTFARAFRSAFGVSASEWRRGARSKIGKTDRNPGMSVGNEGQELHVSVRYGAGHTTTWRVDVKNQNETTLTAHVQVQPLPERTVAYIRHIGPYAGDSDLFSGLFGRLFGWAGPRGLVG